MIIFYGDSFTSGENNNFISYVDKLGIKNCLNKSISGTTIGSYSLYPVKDNDLLNLLYKDEDLKSSKKIILSYGINDIASVTIGNTTLLKVKLELNRCLDYIRQINPHCNIQFILVGDNRSVLKEIAKCQLKYLYYYFDAYFIDLESFEDDYIENFNSFNSFIKNKVTSVFTMFENGNDFVNNLDNDGLHPTDAGYEIIRNNLLKNGFEGE